MRTTLGREEIESLMETELSVYEKMPGKRNSIVGTFCFLEQRDFDFSGARVLEIGCDANLISANYFLKRGASHVVSCNLKVDNVDLARNKTNRIVLVRCDARTQLFGEKFDFIYARAVLEHVCDFSLFLESLDTNLSTTGEVYLDGGPMWDGPHGYHLWCTAPSGRRYTMADSSKVVEPWEHLLLSEGELTARLLERQVPIEDAHAISRFVFNSPEQNRMFSRDIVAALESFQPIEFHAERRGRTQPPRELTQRIGEDIGYNQLIAYGSRP